MEIVSEEKRAALDWVEANRKRLSDFHQEIWRYAETAFREYKSAKAYCDLLREEGFRVEEGSGGMPTAFLATFGRGTPVLGSYAEYDAVPENSQQPVPYKAPREGLHPWAPGHTDPHSALGVAALAGVLAAKAAMQRHGLTGTLRFFGEPAEKVCGSKPVHAAKGYYDGADAYVSYHPALYNTTVWDTHCGAYWSALLTFECLDPETWIDPSLAPFPGHAHAAARCPAALDAVCLMYTTTKYTKEAMFPHTGTWTLNEFIMVAGQCTSDNLPPRLAQIQYAWRSPTLGIQEQIYRVLEHNARQVAEITQCRLSIRWITKTRVGLANHAMADLTYRNLELVGAPTLDEEARRFAREIQQNLGLEPMRDPFLESCEGLIAPQEREADLRRGIPSWQLNFTADDYVDYTWHAPTVRLHTARPTLKPPSAGYQYPAWARNALGGVPSCIDPMMFVAGKTIGATLVDLFTRPEELAKAKAEFAERTGGGVGGTKWVAPLLSRDFVPPIDLRWPEYVTTPRGEEWWIPTPHPDLPG
ncbi:MAG: M20/M25/M40 family metallo-hydrolase [Candidatus Rokuibacteriota bacterium]